MTAPTTGNDALVNAFHEAMRDVYNAAKKHCHYNVPYFVQMVGEHRGLGAARILLRKQEVAAGLTELWSCGRLHTRR